MSQCSVLLQRGRAAGSAAGGGGGTVTGGDYSAARMHSRAAPGPSVPPKGLRRETAFKPLLHVIVPNPRAAEPVAEPRGEHFDHRWFRLELS